MSSRFLLLFAVSACSPTDPSLELSSLEDLQPPPPVLLPPQCSPGSAFEVNGQPAITLARAVDLAGPGDTIVACRGVHTLDDVWIDTPNLTLRGETGDPADVIFRGGSINQGPYFGPGASTHVFELHAITFMEDGDLGVTSAGSFIGGDLVFDGPDARASLDAARVMFFRTRFTGVRGRYALNLGGGFTHEPVIALDEVTFDDHVTDGSVLAIQNFDQTRRAARLMMRDVVFSGNRGSGHDAMVQINTDADVQISGGAFRDNQYDNASLLSVFNVQQDTWIRGWAATDNVVGGPLVSLVGNPYHVWITDSTLIRNDWPAAAPTPSGAALGPEGIHVHLRDVDFGTGADTNTPRDIHGCLTDLGLTTGVIRYPRFCPR